MILSVVIGTSLAVDEPQDLLHSAPLPAQVSRADYYVHAARPALQLLLYGYWTAQQITGFENARKLEKSWLI